MSAQATEDANRKQKIAKKPRKRPGSLLLWVIIVVLLVISASLFIAFKHAQDKLNGKTISTASLEKRVAKLVVLPKGETPTVAVVKDAGKLHNQAFFRDARDGDKLLIYSKARKAVLYRPSTNLVVSAIDQ